MKMILEDLWNKYNLYLDFKYKLLIKGYSNKDIYFININIKLLKELIQKEGINVLDDLLRKTYFRFLVKINRGEKYLLDIMKNPEQWSIISIDKDKEAWISKNVLVFTTENKTAAFSHISRNKIEYLYENNKWQ